MSRKTIDNRYPIGSMTCMNIKIEKNIPLPDKSSGLVAGLKKLKIGDSFLAAADKRATIASSAKYAGIKVATRKEGDADVRIWRTA